MPRRRAVCAGGRSAVSPSGSPDTLPGPPPTLLLLALLAIFAAAGPRPAAAQLGCPMLGCDGRGLFYQADVSLAGRRASKLWSVKTTGAPANLSLGCVGNDNTAVCFAGAVGRPRGLIAVNLTRGAAAWADTKLTDPGLPIINVEGDTIAADGNCMVFVYANGTYLGAECFGGNNSLASSLLQLKDVGQFFYVSRASGLLALFGTDGVCTASMQIIDKFSNITYMWLPMNQPVLGIDTAYFVARRNTTDDAYALYAISFNDQPPFLSVKWSFDLGGGDLSPVDAASALMLSYNGFVLLSLVRGGSGGVLWLRDDGASATVTGLFPFAATSMALYDVDAASVFGSSGGRCASARCRSHRRRSRAAAAASTGDALLWLTVAGSDPCDRIYGFGFDSPFSGPPAFNLSLCDALGARGARVTSRLAVFGYHPDEQVLVVGVTTASVDAGAESASPNLVAALVPVAATKATALWTVATDSSEFVVRGQIVGVRSRYVVAYAGSERAGSVLYIG